MDSRLPVDSSGFSWGEVEFLNEEHPVIKDKVTVLSAAQALCCCVSTTAVEVRLAPAAGSSWSSAPGFLPNLHNKYWLCKHRPSVGKTSTVAK